MSNMQSNTCINYLIGGIGNWRISHRTQIHRKLIFRNVDGDKIVVIIDESVIIDANFVSVLSR